MCILVHNSKIASIVAFSDSSVIALVGCMFSRLLGAVRDTNWPVIVAYGRGLCHSSSAPHDHLNWIKMRCRGDSEQFKYMFICQ